MKNKDAWLGSDNQIYSFLIDSMGNPINLKQYSVKTDFPEQYRLDNINDTLYLFLESGIFFFDQKADSFKIYSSKVFRNQEQYKLLINSPGYPWIKTNGEWICLNSNTEWTKQERSILKLFDDITSIIPDQDKNLWIINSNKQLYKINHSKFTVLRPDFNIFFNEIKNEEGLSFELSNLNFDSENKAIYVKIIAPYYIKKSSTQYQYFVEGLMNDWSDWSSNQDINLIVESGSYTLHVRAKDIWGNRSEIKSIEFTIEPPFTKSIWFYVIIGIVVIAIFIFIAKVRERKLIHDKRILEHIPLQLALEQRWLIRNEKV